MYLIATVYVLLPPSPTHGWAAVPQAFVFVEKATPLCVTMSVLVKHMIVYIELSILPLWGNNQIDAERKHTLAKWLILS